MGAVSWRRKGERIKRDEPDTGMEPKVICCFGAGVLMES